MMSETPARGLLAVAAAERNNKPGQFTAFICYEWSQTGNGNNRHRVVVFRDGKRKTVKVRARHC